MLAAGDRVGDVDWEVDIVSAYRRLSRTKEREQNDPQNVSDEWLAAHEALHASLVSACGSPYRLRLRKMLLDQSERYQSLSVSTVQIHRNLEIEHSALMDAVLQQNGTLAVHLVSEHRQPKQAVTCSFQWPAPAKGQIRLSATDGVSAVLTTMRLPLVPVATRRRTL